MSSAGFSISYPAAFHAFQLPGTLRTSVNPFRQEQARRQTGPVAAVAVHGDGLLLVQPVGFLLQLGQEDVLRTGDVTVLPLLGRADIQHLYVAGAFFDFVNGHLGQSRQRQPGVVPLVHPAEQIAAELRVPDPQQLPLHFRQVGVLWQDEEDRLLGVEHPSGPDGQLGVRPDAHGPRDVSAAERQHLPVVHKLRPLRRDRFLKLLRRRRGGHVGSRPSTSGPSALTFFIRL